MLDVYAIDLNSHARERIFDHPVTEEEAERTFRKGGLAEVIKLSEVAAKISELEKRI